MIKDKIIRLFGKIRFFVKAQFSALGGNIVDYSIMLILTEIFHVHYTVSIVIGGIFGALVNFFINQAWAFRVKDAPYKSSIFNQLIKFTIVAINSILLKSSGTFIITSIFKFDYIISRLIIDAVVSITFNYTFQKYWVFKKKKIDQQP